MPILVRTHPATRSSRAPLAQNAGRRESDAALAAAVLARDPAAAKEAWKRLSPLVLRILRRSFGGDSDCQDLCQEVFLRFFSRIGELRELPALRSFLVGICLGVAQNERRRAHVHRSIMLAPEGDPPELPVDACDHEAREAIQRFLHILTSFDDKDRALFMVRHVEKMAVSDIALVRGWPLATTKRRVARVTRRVGLRMKRDPALAERAVRLLRARAWRA